MGCTGAAQSFNPYPSGRCTREDMLRSSPACIRWRSARKVGNHIGTVPSETCGSNNMPSITYSCLAAAHIVSLRGGWQLRVPSATGSRADTHIAGLPVYIPTAAPSTLHRPPPYSTLTFSPVNPSVIHLSFSFLPTFLSEQSHGGLPHFKDSMRGKARPWLCSLKTLGCVWKARL